MGNVRMRAEQINYGATNVKVALDDLDPKDLIALSARMDTIEAWKATVKAEEKSGSSVEFTNALAIKAVAVSAEIEAIQDLHGYDHPWVGGAGKNKFDVSKIVDSTTVTQSDGVITVKGYAVKPADPCKLSDLAPTLEIGQTYTLSAVSTSTTKMIYLLGANVRWPFGTSKTITQELLNSIVHFYNNGNGEPYAYISDMQIEPGTTKTDFAPYSNICPISGRTAITITQEGVSA